MARFLRRSKGNSNPDPDRSGPASRDAPGGLPRACGALGSFDPARVERIARGLGDELERVHHGESAVLLIDRKPLRWEGPAGSGLAWSQELASSRPPRSWQDAACAAGACGLATGSGRPFVHSNVSGVGPVYYMSAGPATYFATRIDPLVWATPELLNPDWEAWASILAMNLPIGDRTPFAEIKRLGPFATLSAGDAGAEIHSERWPWAEQESGLSVEAGIPDVVDAMRAVIARLPHGPLALPLTGGWDSRVLLCLLRNDPDRFPRCFTTSRETRTWQEEELAGAVARTAGVPHETIEPDPELWWEDVRRHALRADFQFVARPWAVSLARGIADWDERPVLDGLALDTLSQPGTRYIKEEAVLAPTARESGRALWRRLQYIYARPGLVPYRPALRRALWAACERQMADTTERLGDCPSRALLGFYLARTRRGVSLLPTAVMGADLPMVTPFTDDEVARACLAIDPVAKLGVGIHAALLEALDPELAALPSTNDGLPVGPRTRPLRQRTPAALRAMRATLQGGALAPLLRPAIWEELERGEPPNGGLRVVIFHLWEERYREKLAALDPVDGLGVDVGSRAPES